MYKYKLFFDGASKHNPGPSGCGFVIYACALQRYTSALQRYENDLEVASGSAFVGDKITNNYAEYSGLILGMDRAVDLDIKEIEVYGDSKLVIEQMKGNWKVKSENLCDLYHRAKELEKKFDKITFTHIYREFNTRADELSNEYLKWIDCPTTSWAKFEF